LYSLEKCLGSEALSVVIAGTAREGIEQVRIQRPEAVILDVRLPDMSGLGAFDRIRQIDPNLPIIVITAYATIETAVQGLKKGAWDYIVKPVDPDELIHLVTKAIEHRGARREVARLRENLQEVFPKTELIGRSPAMKRVAELVEMVSPADATVLITGESGTGKEVVARAIHANSPRRNMPMVVIHCGALTETLLESELFGHERGAFTGAQFRRKGKFEVADGGTVFLDEISDISLRTQSDLLRVLQEKEIVRVGGTNPVKVDFRCIAATNRSIEELVRAGTFRPDLYYRLNVFGINIPPLRDRREDIPLLADYFIRRFCASTNREPPRLSPQAVDTLMAHDWPGNVRELENAVERALVVSRNGEIGTAHFALGVRSEALSSGGRSLDDVERAHIEKVIGECEGNLSRAARVLQIDRTTLYHKLKRYRANGDSGAA